jgi:hypothetical protein
MQRYGCLDSDAQRGGGGCFLVRSSVPLHQDGARVVQDHVFRSTKVGRMRSVSGSGSGVASTLVTTELRIDACGKKKNENVFDADGAQTYLADCSLPLNTQYLNEKTEITEAVPGFPVTCVCDAALYVGPRAGRAGGVLGGCPGMAGSYTCDSA